MEVSSEQQLYIVADEIFIDKMTNCIELLLIHKKYSKYSNKQKWLSKYLYTALYFFLTFQSISIIMPGSLEKLICLLKE